MDEPPKRNFGRCLITGGCGFIGSALVRRLLRCGADVLNVDKLTYAATPLAVSSAGELARYRFEKLDIGDTSRFAEVMNDFGPDVVIHLAAETHVDRSIAGPEQFIQTNIIGTCSLLDAAVKYQASQRPELRRRFRFLHVSTDEVYGELGGTERPFTEESCYRPSSPYSASKAAADHLARAWARTYGLPVIVTNCCNNYGPFQFPEKLIPTAIIAAIEEKPLPVYGAGRNIREWLYVEDHVSGLLSVANAGRPGETYLIGSGAEFSNLDLVTQLCRMLDEMRPKGKPYERLINFVADRPGHDFRYAIDSRKIRNELGWRPRESFAMGLRKTVQWYLENENWWRERMVRSRDRVVSQDSVS